MPTQAMQRTPAGSAESEQAARRLARPRARAALAAKRTLDLGLAGVMLLALAPLLAVVAALLALDGEPWLERRTRLGRDGQTVELARFRRLGGGWAGRALERVGARELPLLFAVAAGRLSFVGPRPLAPGSGPGHTGPRRLMAPGLTGPAQRTATDPLTASALDDEYVQRWSLRRDLRLLLSGGRHHTVSNRS